MLTVHRLQAAQSLGDLAALLGYQAKALSYIAYTQSVAQRYRTFEIPKKTGGARTLKVPFPALMKLQRRLAAVLEACICDIDGLKGFSTPFAHGFVKNRSIITNASRHKGSRYVLNCDLQDFFGTVTFPRIRGVLIKDKDFALNPKIASLIAHIACHDGSLPQGAPTSPTVSNIVARLLDARMSKIAAAHGCTYSRYADDLTFSTNLPIFPEAIAYFAAADPNIAFIGKSLERAIGDAGYVSNKAKTRLQFVNSRQDVTGLIVNKSVNVDMRYRRLTRAMVHRLGKTGSFNLEADAVTGDTGKPGSLSHLQGRLAHIRSIPQYVLDQEKLNTPKKSRHKSTKQPTHISQDLHTYKKFLFYKYFYAQSLPTILCEGPTDSVYIKAALSQMAKDFPKLVKLNSSGAPELTVRFHSYSRTSAEVLSLSGGGDVLSNFISAYDETWLSFDAGTSTQPTIVLIDNDSGAKGIRNTIKNRYRKEFLRENSVAHITQNLYIVQTPLLANDSDSTIEDFFAASTMATKIHGKTFDAKSGPDDPATYSKVVFAEQVVKKNKKNIDMAGFAPLLHRVEEAIELHSNAPKPS